MRLSAWLVILSSVCVVSGGHALHAQVSGECGAPPAAWLWCDGFTTSKLAQYVRYDSAKGRFTRVQVTADSNWVMEARFPARGKNVGFLWAAVGRTPLRPNGVDSLRLNEVFWRVYVWYDSSWSGGAGGRLVTTSLIARPSGSEAMAAMVRAAGRDTASMQRLAIDPATGTDRTGTVRTRHYDDFTNLVYLGVARGTAPVTTPSRLAHWQCIEGHVRLNSPGTADGVFELWVDTLLQARRQNLQWVGPRFDTRQYGIDNVALENLWIEGAPKPQVRRFDNFVVSRNRVGCPQPKPK
jgi:hypothetical protein